MKKIDSELLKKYATKKCSKEETLAVEVWLESYNEFSEVISEEELDSEIDLIWKNIADDVKPKKKKLFVIKPLKYMAVASIALLIGLATFQLLFQTSSITYQTFKGETNKIVLIDGTVAYLNANTIIKVPKEFNTTNRSITLKGEAYFEVAKDSLHPFVITTSLTKTKVLGTQFNLSAYTNEETVLTLNEGKVAFSSILNPEKKILILPNEQVVLINNERLNKTNVNAVLFNSWIKNELYFNESLSNVFKDLERKYNVIIKTKNPKILNQYYKGYHKNTNLDKVLQKICFVMKLKYEKNGAKIIFY